MPSYDNSNRIVGYHSEPSFGLTWPHIRTLQHLAALIETRSGMFVRVVQSDTDTELFEIRTSYSITVDRTYVGATTWLDAYETGAREVRRQMAGETTSVSVDSGDTENEGDLSGHG